MEHTDFGATESWRGECDGVRGRRRTGNQRTTSEPRAADRCVGYDASRCAHFLSPRDCARDSVEGSPEETPMSADRLTRRAALIGAAALLAPLTPNILVGAPNTSPGKTNLIKLDGNENPYGPSPAARRAILASVSEAPRYADATIETLTNQLAAHEGVAPSQIVIGAGSGELLKMAGLLAVTTASGAEVVASRPTYEELPVFAQTLGLKVHWVAPDTDHRHDLSAMRGSHHAAHASGLRLQPQQPDRDRGHARCARDVHPVGSGQLHCDRRRGLHGSRRSTGGRNSRSARQ